MIALTECKSAMLKAHGYDPATRTLAVRFNNDAVYHYKDVPQEVADAMRAAESVGQFFRTTIRTQFDSERVVQEPEATGE